MKEFLLLIAIMLVMSSCNLFSNKKSDSTLLAFQEMNKAMLNSNDIIDAKNRSILRDFEEKLLKPESSDKAKIWKPKADSIAMISDNIVIYIDRLKSLLIKESENRNENTVEVEKIIIKDKNGQELFFKLKQYKKDVLSIDPTIYNEFENTLPLDSSIQSKSFNASAWTSMHFNNLSSTAAFALLTKFQNDVKCAEAIMVYYCNRKTNSYIEGYDEFNILTATNSQYLKPGQELVILAGVGSFSRKVNPTIIIDSKTIPINSEAIAEYKIKVNKPGKFTKTVKVSFIKPDGTRSTVTKKINYEVGECGGLK